MRRNRLQYGLSICSVYVGLPAFFGVVCAVSLLIGGLHHQGVTGLLLGAGLGAIVGIPLAILQLAAVKFRNITAATCVSVAYWLATAILFLGIVQLILVGSDDETPIRVWPDLLVLLVFGALNVSTALVMGKYARLLRANASNVFRVPVTSLRCTQLDITERFNDDKQLGPEDWIETFPMNRGISDPNAHGLPSVSASESLVYEIASAMSSEREAIPLITSGDGVYCPICHIANIDRSRLRAPCPRCGRPLLSFGWD